MKKDNVFISRLIIRNDKLDKRWTEENQILGRKCLVEKSGFLDNQNLNLKMLNQNEIHMEEEGESMIFATV